MGTQKQFTKKQFLSNNCQRYIAIIIILVCTKNNLWVWFVSAKTVYGIANNPGFLLVFSTLVSDWL